MAVDSEGAHLSTWEMAAFGENLKKGTQHGRLLLHKLEKIFTVDVPHGAIGEGGDFYRDDIIVGKQKR